MRASFDAVIYICSNRISSFFNHFAMAGQQQQALLSTEMVNRGIENSGTRAGSMSFSVRMQRRMPDFVNSVNLKYVMLGCSYLVRPGTYFAAITVLSLIFCVEIRWLIWTNLWSGYFMMNAGFVLGFVLLVVYVHLDLSPRSTYLVDFACYRPARELKVLFFFFFSFRFYLQMFSFVHCLSSHDVRYPVTKGEHALVMFSVFVCLFFWVEAISVNIVSTTKYILDY